MACAICETRRPRRFCPGVRGDICSICCGIEREVTVDCPLDCEYLQEARKHDKPVDLDPSQVPNMDIHVSEKFLSGHEQLLTFFGIALMEAALDMPGAVDFDVREALDSLVRTYRTLQNGVYYETLPQNPLAVGIHQRVQAALAEYRRREQEAGVTRMRDADILGLLVFLQRIEFDRNNGRRRGRAFLGGLRQFYSGADDEAPRTSSLILP